MKGWEIYQKDWGCNDWDKDVNDTEAEKVDRIHHNRVLEWFPRYLLQPWHVTLCCQRTYIRQPTPIQVRLSLQVNLCV